MVGWKSKCRIVGASGGIYVVSSTLLKCWDWSHCFFKLVSENKVGGGCKDVQIPRLIHKPVIKNSSGGGFMECPSVSDKDIKSAIYFIIL